MKIPRDLKAAAAAILFGLSALCLAFFVNGCQTGNSVAYKATGTAVTTVDAAMTAWGDYVGQQKAKGAPVPVQQEIAVRSAYLKYQSAAATVIDAGQAFTAGQSSTNAPTLQQNVNTALAVASSTLSDLVALLAQFGVKIN